MFVQARGEVTGAGEVVQSHCGQDSLSVPPFSSEGPDRASGHPSAAACVTAGRVDRGTGAGQGRRAQCQGQAGTVGAG